MATAPQHKLFFAIQPPPAAAMDLSRLAGRWARDLRTEVRLMPPGRLHVSLNGLGAYDEAPDERIARASAAVASVSMPSFVVALDRVGPWGRGSGIRPVVAWADDGLIGVRLLHGHIHAVLAAVGLAPAEEPGLEPHLTLLRAKTAAAAEFIDPVSWRVQEFVLLDSLRGERRDDVLGRWPLSG